MRKTKNVRQNFKTLLLLGIFFLFSRTAFSNPNELLLRAVMNGNLQQVSELLNQGANPNYPSTDGFETTPLFIAASHGCTDIFNLLVSKGADLNHIDRTGYTALIYAAGSGQLELVKTILNHPEVNINHTNKTGMTALDYSLADSIYTPTSKPAETREFLISRKAKTQFQIPIPCSKSSKDSPCIKPGSPSFSQEHFLMDPSLLQTAESLNQHSLTSEQDTHHQDTNYNNLTKSLKENLKLLSPLSQTINQTQLRLEYIPDSKPNSRRVVNVIYNYLSDRKLREADGAILEKCQFDTLLHGKQYNFIILPSGQIVCGLVENSWEIGVKHISLANKNLVLIAGEVLIDDQGKIIFNLSSGAFTMSRIEHQSEAQKNQFIVENSELILASLKEFSKPNTYITFVRYGFHRNPPDASEIKALCNKGDFRFTNRSLCREIAFNAP